MMKWGCPKAKRQPAVVEMIGVAGRVRGSGPGFRDADALQVPLVTIDKQD